MMTLSSCPRPGGMPERPRWLQARIADPPAEVVELCRSLVSAFADAGDSRTPQAAAQVMLDAVTKLQEQNGMSSAG